jgi:hypothetical protein
MTDICVLGTRTIAELTTLYQELGKMFDARTALSLRRDLQNPEEIQSKAGKWICVIPSVPLTTMNPSRQTHISFTVARTLSKLILKQKIVFSLVRVRNLESYDQGIARVFVENPSLNIVGLLESEPIILDAYYANV